MHIVTIIAEAGACNIKLYTILFVYQDIALYIYIYICTHIRVYAYMIYNAIDTHSYNYRYT